MGNKKKDRDGGERVKPQLARGLRDLAAGEAASRLALIDLISRVYTSYGFAPLLTPAIELWDVLVGDAGPEAREQVFRVDSPEDVEQGLRFDLTVPLSRYVAANRQGLPRPFRRYQISPVWRKDKPGPGRFREFTQADIDIVGTTNPLADAECVAAVCEVMQQVAPGQFRVRMSDRRALNVLMTRSGLPSERGPEVFRVLDKLDRIGAEKVALELTTGYEDESGDTIAGLGLGADSVTAILQFLKLGDAGATPRTDVLAALKEFFGETEGASEALEGMAALAERLEDLEIPEDQACFDLSIARGLAYYTGPVFEIELSEEAGVGSVGGGGRYDDLVGRFSAEAWPGVGFSIGIDRLLAGLAGLGRLDALTAQLGSDVLVTVMDKKRVGDCLKIARELRAGGIRTEVWTGGSRAFAKQVKHADRLGIPIVVIAGGDELAKGVVTLKWMAAATEGEAGPAESREDWLAARQGQQEVPRTEVVSHVLAMLGRGDSAPSRS